MLLNPQNIIDTSIVSCLNSAIAALKALMLGELADVASKRNISGWILKVHPNSFRIFPMRLSASDEDSSSDKGFLVHFIKSACVPTNKILAGLDDRPSGPGIKYSSLIDLQKKAENDIYF